MVWTKFVEKIKTYWYVILNTFLSKTVSKNNVQSEGPQMTSIWRMRVACSISEKATHAPAHPTPASTPSSPHTHCFSAAVKIRERVLILCYTYIVCLVITRLCFPSEHLSVAFLALPYPIKNIKLW